MSKLDWFYVIVGIASVLMVIVQAFIYPLARFFIAGVVTLVCSLNSATDLSKDPGSWFWRISTLLSGSAFVVTVVWLFRWYAKGYRAAQGRRAT
ncbi:MAG: hypothetical protein JWO13_1271 [Acidobacteriales bacterium]|nr:hypothetical protein [Terriglobales bacterium]